MDEHVQSLRRNGRDPVGLYGNSLEPEFDARSFQTCGIIPQRGVLGSLRVTSSRIPTALGDSL